MGLEIISVLDKVIVILGQANVGLPLIKNIVDIFKAEYPGDIPELSDLEIISKAKNLNAEEIAILKSLLD